MAIHAYRAVERWAEENDAKADFIYLDAHSMCLQFEPLYPEDGHSTRKEYIGRAVVVTLEDMLSLHGWKLLTVPIHKALLTDTAMELSKLFANKRGKAWLNWKNRELKQCKKSNRKWKKEDDLQNINLSFPADTVLQPIVNSMRQAFQVGSHEQSFNLGIASRQSGFQKTAEICAWLEGKWFEHLVLDALTQVSDNLHLNQCLLGVETKGVQFEVDVIAIRGYQMFAFSCTTLFDKGPFRSQLKKRLFEANIRAQQLAGDEARAALVCMAEDPNGLCSEMQRDFDQEKRVMVFGCKHLANLKTHITQWIREQSKEEGTRCNKSYL